MQHDNFGDDDVDNLPPMFPAGWQGFPVGDEATLMIRMPAVEHEQIVAAAREMNKEPNAWAREVLYAASVKSPSLPTTATRSTTNT